MFQNQFEIFIKIYTTVSNVQRKSNYFKQFSISSFLFIYAFGKFNSYANILRTIHLIFVQSA